MTTEFKDIQAKAKSLMDGFGTRNQLYKEIEEAYLLDDSIVADKNWIKKTVSVDARNKLLGATRLLTAADPIWSVPRDKNKSSLEEPIASKVEKAARMIWDAAGKVKKQPIHYNAVLSALLYGQVDIAVTNMQDVIELEKNPVRKKRLEKIAKKTPLMFEVLSPKVCYPIYDAFGLSAHYTYRDMKATDIIARLGDKAKEQLKGKNATDEVGYSEYWDEEYHAIWLDGQDKPLMFKPHELDMIPIASAIVEGGELFDEEHARQPFLYGLVKSGIHARQSLMLTLFFSNAFTTGANPVMVYKTNDLEKSLKIDYETPGGVVKILPGEDLSPMERETIDSNMKELFAIAENKAEESTIYSQTLGEPLGGNAPFSMVALLSQSGRLPLVPYQRMLSSIFTDAMEIGLSMLRSNGGGKLTVGPKDTGIELDMKEVPEDIELTATLGIEMPQDEFSQARIAMELTEKGMVSKERAREKYLHIGQSDDEERQILREKFTAFLADTQFQMKAQEIQQQMQAQMMQQQQQMQGMGQPGMPPQGQVPPEMMAQMQGMGTEGMMPGMNSAQEGLPMGQPQMPGQNPEEMLPPEMQGGI